MSENGLQSAILDDLLASGAPLEMRVAAGFLRTPLIVSASPYDLNDGPAFDSVSQGVHFWDEAADLNRETDVVAITWNRHRAASVTFVAECKHRDGGGLVVFYGPEGTSGGHLQSPAATSSAAEWIADRGSAGFGDTRLMPGLRGPAGYGMRFMPATKQKDHAYEAIRQVTNAAHALVPRRSSEFHLVFPVVVTDVPLFRCQLTAEGEPLLTSADRGWIRWPHPTHRGYELTIHVVCEYALDSFLADAGAAAHEILATYSG